MPTRLGKAKKDDIIVNTVTGVRWRVLERVGNDELYAVRLVPLDPQHWRTSEDRRRGYMLMTEAAYWLKHGWRFD